jgi:eukaryotic-like serine/threonine-protein kinase
VSLEPGTRVGPYEITGQLGAGGMGEVCRARDTKLNREVALKVLPDSFAADADRKTRFQREATLLAALNHPNIAAIYGLEDAGPRQAIVMELVEGATLTGPIALDDGLRIAKQIAEAIEYAHERGIIHRDLKPANIKVTPDGTVKVLDFGLAKAMDDVSDTAVAMAGTMSPTLSLGATYAGVIMGTAAYMAPEQAKGRPADRRSDIWAFGIVLYEMLTGDRMFGGDSVPETLASVMKDPITFGKLPEATPSPVRKLVSRCLERDPRRRLQSIGEARIVLEDTITGVAVDDGAPRPAVSQPSSSKWLWAVAATGLLVGITAIGWEWSRPTPTAAPVTRFLMPPPDGASFTAFRAAAPNLAVSPNGRYVAFVADQPGKERALWVRALDSLLAHRLDRTEGAVYPFWSPDSENIAYFSGGKLMRVAVAGGAPLTISAAPDGEGGTWYHADGQDDVIIFAADQNGPLRRVLAKGGVSTTVTKLAPDETAHTFPQFLPDGKRFLYLARGQKPGIYVQALGNDTRTFVVATNGRALFSPPGFLLYPRESSFLAQRLNVDTMQLQGEPQLIGDDIRNGGGNGRNALAVSGGVLAYRHGGGGVMQVTWYTRDGKPAERVLESDEYGTISLSPDNTRLVVVRGSGEDRDLWLKDLTSGSNGVFSRLTSAPGAELWPVWLSDSRTVVYRGRNGNSEALLETVIGSGKHTVIPTGDTQLYIPADATPEGKQLVLRIRRSITLLPIPSSGAPSTGDTKPRTIFEESYGTDQVHVSPDGKWVAYMSFESGQAEVFVASFPSFSDRRQVSTGGGVQPIWRPDGKELFFVSPNQQMMAVDITPGTSLQIGSIRTLFLTSLVPTNGTMTYAVSRDGQRFLLREPLGRETGAAEQLYIVTNWTSLVSH